MEKKANSPLPRFNRVLVWLTYVLLVFFVICGFGIVNPTLISSLTGGILNHSLSSYLHTTLALPVVVLLVIHGMIGLRSNLIRWGIKEGIFLNGFVVSLGGFFVLLFVLLQFVRY